MSESMCVCVRTREKVWECVSVCVRERKRDKVCKREKVCVCV